MTLTGYDVSSYQTVGTCLDRDFLIVKASEGKGGTGYKHDAHVTAARGAGLEVGHYHFAWPANGADADFANFERSAKVQPGDTIHLDWEPYGQMPAAEAVKLAVTYIPAFAALCLRNLGLYPTLYGNNDWLRQLAAGLPAGVWSWIRANLPLWKALYVSDPAKGPGDTFGFANVALFQWSETPVDQDVFYGDRFDWRALGRQDGGMMANWRGVRVDGRTADMLNEMCLLLDVFDGGMGAQVQATQGSYSTAVGVSGGTHAGGGAVDLARFRKDGREWTWDELVKIANRGRQVGLAMWPRERIPNVWERHVHGVAIACSDLSISAKDQVVDYKAGRNGLANNGPDTPGCTRAYVNVTWETYVRPTLPVPPKRSKEDDDMPVFVSTTPEEGGKIYMLVPGKPKIWLAPDGWALWRRVAPDATDLKQHGSPFNETEVDQLWLSLQPVDTHGSPQAASQDSAPGSAEGATTSEGSANPGGGDYIAPH